MIVIWMGMDDGGSLSQFPGDQNCIRGVGVCVVGMVEGAFVVGVMLHVMQIFRCSRENHIIRENSSALPNSSQLLHQFEVLQVNFLHVVHHHKVELPVVFYQLLHAMQCALMDRYPTAQSCVFE